MEIFKYSGDIDVPATREKLLPKVSNPILFAGVTGHILVLKAYDHKAEDFVPFSALTFPSDRFRVVYTYGLCNEEIRLFRGYLEKDGETQVGVMYRGRTDDGRVSWETVVELLPVNSEETRLQVSVTARYAIPHLLGLGSGKLDLPKFIEHIFRDHVEPYFRLYTPGQETRGLDVKVTVVRSLEGPLNEVILKAWDYIEDLGLGVVKIEGREIRGTISVMDGKIKEIRLFHSGKMLKDDDAVAKIMELSSPVKVSIYTVDTESLIGAIMGHSIG